MNLFKTLSVALTVAAALVLPLNAADKDTKAKPYTLKTCIVTDEALGGDHGEPYTFVNEGQEFKLCCKPCMKDFDKDPKYFHKKLAKAAKKTDKSEKKK